LVVQLHRQRPIRSGASRLEPPEGTCYLARDEIAALLEKLGGRTGGGVSEDYFSSLRLVKLRVPIAHNLADLTSRRASGFGVTSEVGTIVPYDRPRAWAASLRSSGFDGIAYRLRHDPSASEGLALFGPEGERSEWPPGDECSIGEHLLGRLQAESGLEVLARPRLSDLRIEGPEGG
jgi:hypothetical protein